MLYILPTPIGNSQDVTIRTLDMYRKLHVFLCEDTRTFKKLLNILEIDAKWKQFFALTSFTDKWKIAFYSKLISEQKVGLVSEAGMPGISDPGKEIIKICWKDKLDFEILPGPTAISLWVVWACFDTSNFVFLGFLPTKKWRQTKFQYIIDSPISVFVYESVHRIEKTLTQLQALGFDRNVFVGRELTKMYEQKVCKPIDEVLEMIKNKEIVIKWEFVVWFEGLGKMKKVKKKKY